MRGSIKKERKFFSIRIGRLLTLDTTPCFFPAPPPLFLHFRQPRPLKLCKKTKNKKKKKSKKSYRFKLFGKCVCICARPPRLKHANAKAKQIFKKYSCQNKTVPFLCVCMGVLSVRSVTDGTGRKRGRIGEVNQRPRPDKPFFALWIF